jgi:hypothetical protein
MNQQTSIPSLPLTGGCQCGNVTYELSGLPVVFYLCHCTECQKQSSSAFGESLQVRKADLAITGNYKTYTRSSDSGFPLRCDFCPDCGTRLFHRRDNRSEVLNIKAGTLNDTTWLKPAGHIWAKSKQTWFEIGPDELAYDTQPDDLGELTQRWQEMTGA